MYKMDFETVKQIFNELIASNTYRFDSVFDITMFISVINRRFAEEIKKLTMQEKITKIQDIGNYVIDELEIRALVTIELARDFRNILKNTDSYRNMFQGLSDFFDAPMEEKKAMISDFLCGFIQKMLVEDKKSSDNIEI